MIKITGTTKRSGEDEELVELTTEARIYEKAGSVYIVYESDDTTGSGEAELSTLKVNDDSARMIRFGKNKEQLGRLDFVVGEEHKGLYLTPFGNLDVVISTKEIENRMSAEEGGYLDIRYRVTLMGKIEADSSMRVEVIGG